MKTIVEATIRPYNDQELQSLFRAIVIIRDKITKAEFLVNGYSPFYKAARIDGVWITPKDLLKNYERLDGSPCGIETE